MNASAGLALRRTAQIAVVGQVLIAAVMAYAAVDSTGDDRSMFWALAAGAALGAVAAFLLGRADHRSADASSRINQAVLVLGLGFCAGALGALFGRNPLILSVPVVVLLIDAMLVGAARAIQSEPSPD